MCLKPRTALKAIPFLRHKNHPMLRAVPTLELRETPDAAKSQTDVALSRFVQKRALWTRRKYAGRCNL
ncbi:hypothetical protein Ct61P_01330 [Colletotrichum tofieldiae]|nr:hypothetical protein Ct61P_01330 [Colletotrichum tofieldiae]